MSKAKNPRYTRAEMEEAKLQSEQRFSGTQRTPRRYKLYDRIKDHVSLRTVDTVIIVTAALIVALLIYGIATGGLVNGR